MNCSNLSASVATTETRDLWAWWPDDFMCPMDETSEYTNPPCARSDDFQIVEVTAYDEHDSPSQWSATSR